MDTKKFLVACIQEAKEHMDLDDFLDATGKREEYNMYLSIEPVGSQEKWEKWNNIVNNFWKHLYEEIDALERRIQNADI